MPQLVMGHPLCPSKSTVTDADERRHYWSALLRDWGAPSGKSHFPGSNPLSMSRSTLSDFRRERASYGIALKSDGVRYVLYCTLRPGSSHDAPHAVALMVDRSQNMFEVDLVATEEVFTRGTILEGELVWKQPEETSLLFLVFDCIMVKGESMTRRPFTERLAAATRLTRLSEELSRDDNVEERVSETDCLVMMQYAPTVTMRPKVFVDVDNAVRLWNDRSEVNHRVDGLVLQRLDMPYAFGGGRHGESFKWKERSTVDLAGPELRAADGALPRTLFGPRVRASTDSRITPQHDADVLEYLVTVTESEISLFALRRRQDKDNANGIRVVQATIRDVIDEVGVHEL